MADVREQSPIRVTVWGENVHERTEDHVREIYPDGMHTTIAAGARRARSATACASAPPRSSSPSTG